MSNKLTTSINPVAVMEIVRTCLQEILAMTDSTGEVNIAADTRLIGREAVLDSMGLVNLIVEVEQRLEEELDVTVVLADERAMSQKNSPFRSVQSLTDYICQIAQE